MELLFRLDRVRCGDGQLYGELLRIIRKLVFFQKVGILKFVGVLFGEQSEYESRINNVEEIKVEVWQRVTAVE